MPNKLKYFDLDLNTRFACLIILVITALSCRITRLHLLIVAFCF